jgi:hypothetical protein
MSTLDEETEAAAEAQRKQNMDTIADGLVETVFSEVRLVGMTVSDAAEIIRDAAARAIVLATPPRYRNMDKWTENAVRLRDKCAAIHRENPPPKKDED